ncbi:MAG: LamG domain-containing protein [Chthoniobacterales bacterium]
MKTTIPTKVKNTTIPGALAILVACMAFTGLAKAATLNEYLFDTTISTFPNNSGIYNQVTTGNSYIINPYGVYPSGTYDNLQVAGGKWGASTGMFQQTLTNQWGQGFGPGSTGLAGLGSFTMEMWVNPFTNPALETPLNFNGVSLNLQSVAGGYRLVSQFYTTGLVIHQAFAVGVISTGTWWHIAMTYDGTTLKQYINGTLDGSIAATGLVINNGSGGLFIGANTGSSQTFFGDIDEVRISDVALPAGTGTGVNQLAWNASLVAVPEPATVAMGMMAMGGFAFMRLIRRKRSS